MELINDMRHKVLSAFEAIVQGCGLDWVEVQDGEDAGAVWFQRAGELLTLVRLDYEFGPRTCRLLLYRDGRHAAGRCGIRYDDGATIQAVLDRFRDVMEDQLLGPCTAAAPLDGDGLHARLDDDTSAHRRRLGHWGLGRWRHLH